MRRDTALAICGVSKHQYYYLSNGRNPGLQASTMTKRLQKDQTIEVSNVCVVEDIKLVHQDPDTDYGYHKMTSHLGILGVSAP